MKFSQASSQDAEQTITYVTAVAICEAALKSLDFFAPFFIPISELSPGLLFGTIIGVGVRIPVIWYLYYKKSRIASIVFLCILLFRLLAGGPTHIFFSIFFIAACVGVYETFRYHATKTIQSTTKAPRVSIFRRYVYRPMTLVWVGYVILSFLSIGLYLASTMTPVQRPNFTDTEISSLQQALLQMQSGEWDTQEAVSSMTPEMREKIRQMGITEEEFLRRIIVDIASKSLGIDLQ